MSDKPAVGQTNKTTIKASGKELKMIIKEVIKELITEGFFNNVNLPLQTNQQQPQPQNSAYNQDPRINLAAQLGNQIGKGNKVLENVFVDTMMNTVPAQHSADPRNLMGGMYGQMQQPYYQPPMQMQQPQQNYYQQPPMQQNNPYIQPVGGMMETMQSQSQQQYMHHQQPQQQQQQYGGARASHWASLAFNKPISNRPSSANTLSLLSGIE